MVPESVVRFALGKEKVFFVGGVALKFLPLKEQLRKRIEEDSQLKKDFDFFIAKTGWTPDKLLTGLRLHCNLMKADEQTILSHDRKQNWPMGEDKLRRFVRNVRRTADQIEATDKAELSPAYFQDSDYDFAGLPNTLRAYATELERRTDLQATYWKGRRSRVPTLVALTRENSIYERIRSSSGKYHLCRLWRLINATRDLVGLPPIGLRAFTMWLNRLRKRKKAHDSVPPSTLS